MKRPSPDGVELGLLLAILALAAAWNVATGLIGLGNAISDSFGWRQTQTAITAYCLKQGGPFWRYETPVLGPPWSLIHEFPLYQGLVALLSAATGLPLEMAGRLVSRAFFYAALPPLWLLLAEIGVRSRHRLVFISLWLFSPYYAFWSRTFMIESTALFCAICFLAFALRFLHHRGALDAIAAAGMGALGAAVKPPTMPAFLGLATLAWFASGARPLAPEPRCPARDRDPTKRRTFRALSAAAVFLIPVVAGGAWHRWADAVKSLNPLAGPWTSGHLLAMLLDFGPGDWRFRLGTWEHLLREIVPSVVGHAGTLALALVAVLCARRRRLHLALAIAAFLAVFVTFAVLHMGHAYYPYANGLFLVGALAFGVVALLEASGPARWAGLAMLAVSIAAAAQAYHSRVLPVQQRNAYRGPSWLVRLARQVERHTSPSDVIVSFGLDWSPELPYYARRRALMWPRYFEPIPQKEPMEAALANLAGYRVGALVNCWMTHDGTLETLRRHFGLDGGPLVRVADCEVFLPPTPGRVGEVGEP